MALDNKIIKSIIEAHVKRGESEYVTWDKDRALYRCENWGPTDRSLGQSGHPPDNELYLESGAMYAYVDTMVASVVPTNAQVTCNARRSGYEKTAQYRERLINYNLRTMDTHRLLWRLATFASVNPRGVIKAVWNYKAERPEFRVLDPKYFFYDTTASRYEDIKYCCEVTVLSESEFAERIASTKRGKKNKKAQYNKEVAEKATADQYPKWLLDMETGGQSLDSQIRDAFKWYVIYEFHDFTIPGGRVLHFVSNGAQVIPEPIFESARPYVFLANPYYLHVFNDSLEDTGGMSDASIIRNPVRRRDELSTLMLRYLHTAIPIMMMDESKVENPESAVDQIANANQPGDVARLKLKADVRFEDAFGYSQPPQLNPAFSSIDQLIDGEIQYRLGMPAYVRGQAGASDVATEFALIDKALNTRQGRRVKAMYDVVRFMAVSIIRLYEEFMTESSTIPMSLGGAEFVEIQRADIAARSVAAAKARIAMGLEPQETIYVDYDVVPSSPVENSKQVMLQRLKDLAQIVVNNPRVDQEDYLRELLKNAEVDVKVQKPPAAQLPPGNPGAPDEKGGISPLPPTAVGPADPAAGLAGALGATNGGNSPMPNQLNPLPNGLAGLAGGPGIKR